MKLHQNRDWLYQKYVVEELSTSQVAKISGCCAVTVLNYLKKYNIPTRKRGSKACREVQSRLAQTYWSDPANRLAHSRRLVSYWDNKDARAAQSRRIKAAMTPEVRAKISASGRRRDPSWIDRWRANLSFEERERRRQVKIEFWKNEENRRAHSQFMREFWSVPGNKQVLFDMNARTWTDEKRAEHSQHMREIAKDPTWREKVSRGLRDFYKDPANRERLSRRLRRVFSDPDLRRRLSVMAKARWEAGVYRGVFQSPTTIEVAVRNALKALSLVHQEQFHPKGYSRVYDFLVLPNILIEVQGDYWHNWPNGTDADREKEAWANENGYYFIEIWEWEIHSIGADVLVSNRVVPLCREEISKQCLDRRLTR